MRHSIDLIDRYLIAVRRQLPRDLEADIASELADSLRSEAEEHERAAGRPLTPDEQAALLKKRGQGGRGGRLFRPLRSERRPIDLGAAQVDLVDLPQAADVVERVGIEDDEIGGLTRLDRPDVA